MLKSSMMLPFSRGLVSKSLSLLLLIGLGGLAGCDQNEGAPDLIVYNANILTIDEARPRAQAFAVKEGIFSHVGSNEEVRALADADTQSIDAKGQTIIPGFNDPHLHALFIPPTAAKMSRATSKDEIVALMKEQAAHAKPGEWIVGYGYDDTIIGGHLGSKDLDRISTTNPVIAIHASLHLFAVNAKALTAAGLTSATPDPDGGVFYRDKEGALTGLMGERPALSLLFVEGQPTFFPHDFQSAVDGLDAFFDKALANGITSYGDALVPAELALAYWWADPEEAGVRVNLMYDGKDIDGAQRVTTADDVLSWIGLGLFDGSWLRAKTIKLFHGHSLSGRTARLFDEYSDRPGYFGDTPQRTQAELDAIIARVHELGFQAAVHANGDFEIDMVLTAMEKAVAADPRLHRHRLEHASIVNDDLLTRSKELEIVLAPHSYVYEKGPMIEAYGEERWDRMFANRSTFDLGIPNAGNSDFPVAALSPLLRIQSLVTRTSYAGKVYGASQRLTVDQALYAYTMGSAFATFEENQKGSITPGKYADFTFLSADPHDVAPGAISMIEVEATYSDGIKRFQK